VPTRLIATLGSVELERLLAVASRRDRLIIALLLDTGLRLSELAGLRVGDLLPDGYLRVRGKGGKERLVPLGTVTEARLPDYLAHGRPRPVGRDVDHIFLARDGRPLSPVAIQHALRRLGRRAGLTGVRTNPHTFRHTFAKLYLLNRGDLFSLQRILGHTTLDMVRRYVNLDTGEVKRQHAQASPVDRLAIGPKVSVLLPWPVADRLEELAYRERTSIEELVRRATEELVARTAEPCVPTDVNGARPSAA
jgi:site-specific recombinase XerD